MDFPQPHQVAAQLAQHRDGGTALGGGKRRQRHVGTGGAELVEQQQRIKVGA